MQLPVAKIASQLFDFTNRNRQETLIQNRAQISLFSLLNHAENNATIKALISCAVTYIAAVLDDLVASHYDQGVCGL